ncbi:MAG: type II toxin-antitoxin system PemK/MazF family toxin [Burkholderiales bacterium]|nr:type II toxin-antitoxin system PemK/MazF family toxin [Burkholderiales bacterium]OQY65494.1 MAG: growth inhibitor PemK [Rhodocyclaceae bacterium UTPRO2]
MRRGDLVTVALQGDLGKPRPALVIQSDLFNETHPSVTLAPLTGDIRSAPLFRITIEPSTRNGLREVSQVMVDKLISVRRDKLGQAFGRLEDENILRVNRALAVWVGLA